MKYLFWDTERIKNTKIYMLAYILTDEFFNISKQKIIIDTSIDLSKRHAPRIKVNQLIQEATCVSSFKELFNEILPFINDENITKVCFGKDDYAAVNDQLKLHNLQPVEGTFVDFITVLKNNNVLLPKINLSYWADKFKLEHDPHNPLSDSWVLMKIYQKFINENPTFIVKEIKIPNKNKILDSSYQ